MQTVRVTRIINGEECVAFLNVDLIEGAYNDGLHTYVMMTSGRGDIRIRECAGWLQQQCSDVTPQGAQPSGN